ncbi:MAG: bifunctional metallophosphatase/5'-nucleotidase [Polyangiaceae bacterium]|nr:bifunctional metallophosphatase/5'-nucleotidase [Polyangiaceae bacterium]
MLAINDLHGQLPPAQPMDGRPVGGAAVLAAYLRAEVARAPRSTLIASAGDLVGASPPSSGLLHDEPAIMLLNELGGPGCTYADRLDPGCPLVATVGNHEFDDGAAELLRLIDGGDHRAGPGLEDPYRGARFPVVCANVLERDTDRPLFPPYVIKRVRGMAMGFIGAVLHETPRIVTPSGIRGLEFSDEVEAINRQARQLSAQGVAAIGVLLHQGGSQEPYAGRTRPDVTVQGPIAALVRQLDDSVDFVASGHYHGFTNAWLPSSQGRRVLVTQAYSAGRAFARISLALDPRSQDVTEASAEIIPTFADVPPGDTPDRAAKLLVARAEEQVESLTERVAGRAARPLTREASAAGESALGSLIADAQRAALHSDVALTNPWGIRADIDAGVVTWGELFCAQPFGNDLVMLRLTGHELIELLNAQWGSDERFLQTSGLEYTWDPDAPTQQNRIVEARVGGKPLNPKAIYTVTVNRYLAEGGGGYSLLAHAPRVATAPSDLEALFVYLKSRPEPFEATIQGRIRIGSSPR